MARNPHPSGRPIRRTKYVERPIWRIPDSQPNVPRLRRGELVSAIGFLHHWKDAEDGDDDLATRRPVR